jgi:hypothetical protein
MAVAGGLDRRLGVAAEAGEVAESSESSEAAEAPEIAEAHRKSTNVVSSNIYVG